jgi:hypothetical protein
MTIEKTRKRFIGGWQKKEEMMLANSTEHYGLYSYNIGTETIAQ